VEYYAKGLYEYYHYGDQSFNDHGWGCAYRSLQTLLSWLNLQGHLRLPRMLTIPQIQALIDRINLGSREKLRDSKEWIGATEVAWVVKHLTNYDCRILHVSDGKKILEEC
jgi:Ufm1-specific protease 2